MKPKVNLRPRQHAASLRIVLVSETYAPEINGVAMTLSRLVGGLREAGHHITVIRPRQATNDRPFAEPGYEERLVTGIPIPGYPDLRCGLATPARLRKFLHEIQPDVLHIATEGPLGMAALRAATSLEIPVTSSFHTNFHRYTGHYGVQWLRGVITSHLRSFHNKTLTTLVPTQTLAAELGADGFRNIKVLARGIDTRLFSSSRRSNTLREQWQLDEQQLGVIYVGRLAAEKNLDCLIASFRAIQVVRPDARLILVGSGPQENRLRERCPDAIFCGPQTGEALAQHYASADMFLFPSLTETFGNVTTEAMASGLAVVAYAYAAAAEFIVSNDNGITVQTGDEAAFIEAACLLASNPAQLATLKSRASKSMSGVSWQNIIDTFAQVLREAHNKQQRSHHARNSIVLAPD